MFSHTLVGGLLSYLGHTIITPINRENCLMNWGNKECYGGPPLGQGLSFNSRDHAQHAGRDKVTTSTRQGGFLQMFSYTRRLLLGARLIKPRSMSSTVLLLCGIFTFFDDINPRDCLPRQLQKLGFPSEMLFKRGVGRVWCLGNATNDCLHHGAKERYLIALVHFGSYIDEILELVEGRNKWASLFHSFFLWCW